MLEGWIGLGPQYFIPSPGTPLAQFNVLSLYVLANKLKNGLESRQWHVVTAADPPPPDNLYSSHPQIRKIAETGNNYQYRLAPN